MINSSLEIKNIIFKNKLIYKLNSIYYLTYYALYNLLYIFYLFNLN